MIQKELAQREYDDKTNCLLTGMTTLGSALLLLIALLMGTSTAFAKDCVLIDSDAHLDDIRAVAILAPAGIDAVIITEGIARSEAGARAMRTFLDRAKLETRVIVGDSADPGRNYIADRDFEDWRKIAETLNGTLPASSDAPAQPNENFVQTIRNLAQECSKIHLVVIGPWTSFLRYAPVVLPKVDRITVQGRPYPDELTGEPDGFNCKYDHEACLTSFDLLIGWQSRAKRNLRANWVDIPNGPERCGSAETGVDESGDKKYAFSPNGEWIKELRQAGGVAGVIAAILDSNAKGWNESSLWDDLAALYLVRPELFGRRGGHFEPCVSANAVRNHIIKAISKKPRPKPA